MPTAVRRRRSGLARFSIYLGLLLLAVVTAGIGLLVIAPPVDLVRDRLAAEVERQTGRKLAIGSAGISLASGLGVTLKDISLSAPPSMPGAPLLTAAGIDVRLDLLPLILREVKVRRLDLISPVLSLRIDAGGRRSWDFASLEPAGPAPVRYAQVSGRVNDASRLPPEVKDFVRNASPPGTRGDAGSLPIEGVSLTNVRIKDGVVRYQDARTGFVREMSAIDAKLSLPTLGGQLAVKGHFTALGERLEVDARAEPFRDLVAQQPASVRLSLKSPALDLGYEGRLTTGTAPAADGRIELKAASAENLARLADLHLDAGGPLGAVLLAGNVKSSAGSVAFDQSRFELGETSGTGSFTVDTSRARPRITANVRFAVLDLERLGGLTVQGGTRSATSSHPAPSAPASASPARFAAPPAVAPTAPPRSIDDLIGRAAADDPAPSPAAKVKGFRQRLANTWETEAFDVALLRGIDLDARIQIATLRTATSKAGGIVASGLNMGLDLKDGVLRSSITDGTVAGGKVRGLASIDATKPTLAVGANISGDAVGVLALLKPAGIDLIDGRGRAVITVTANGTSERELVSTLAGRAEVKVTEGALVGWDADAIVAGLGRGQLPPSKRQPDARTSFDELSGTFQIAQGVARSRDLKLDSKTLQAAGTGTINIVDRNLDLILKPRIGSGGLEVPIRIAGPWTDPTVVADVAGAINSPQAQQAVRKLKDGDVDGALRSVLGGGPKADEKIGKAKELLRGFLGR